MLTTLLLRIQLIMQQCFPSILQNEQLKGIKEDDNPVVILVTLKPKKDNKQ